MGLREEENAFQQKKYIEDDSENANETSCGIGRFRPNFLQAFANINAFVGAYSFIGLISQTLSVYVNSQVPALEKQFGLNSAESGLVMSFNDIGFFTTVLFAASVMRFVHIPRFIYFCMILYGLSGVLCSIPHFIAQGKGLLDNFYIESSTTVTSNNTMFKDTKSELLCDSTRILQNLTDQISCAVDSESKFANLITPSISIKKTALGLIGIGMVLQGIGKSPRTTAFLLYVDDNADRRKTGFYGGIAVMFSIFGPALSYGLGGVFSRMYVTLEDVDMNPRDPRWIGAWWLGFLVFGSASFILSTVLLCFPRRLQQSGKEKAKGKKIIRTEEFEGTLKEKIKDRLFSYWRVVKNPIYILLEFQSVCVIISVGGYIAFLSKYITRQFGVPLHIANYILAGTNLSSVALGAFFGGLVTRKIQMTPRNGYKVLSILFVIHNTLFLVLFFLGCEQEQIQGPSGVHKFAVGIPNNCSSNCHCDVNDIFPVCGSDGINYHSPCYAGCDESVRGGRMYSNCTCIPDGKATAGFCKTDCPMIYPWAIVNFLSSVAGAMKIMPNRIIMIRCVKDTDKATAIGLSAFLGSALGWALSPIFYGKMVDTTCLIWQSSCEGHGACEFYDIEDFRWKFHTFGFVFKMLALFTSLFSLWKVWNWKHWESDCESNHEKINHSIPEKQTVMSNDKELEEHS